MQLAHQARTKKKITKDSLLARFNFPVAASKAGQDHEASATSSSRAPSEDEAEKSHDTPPTSPPTDIRSPKLSKGKGRALSVEPVEQIVRTQLVTMPGSGVIDEQPLKPTIKPLTGPLRAKTPSLHTIWSDDDDSGSDLEVITSGADKRKYAVFEHLRAKKSKEAPSHIALRSLANLIRDDRKRSGSAAEVEAQLRRLAREQAQQEKQHRLDELMAKGVIIQTAEEREREQQEVEDLLERARQEAVDIQKREKAAAKKEGNYTKDDLDDEDESDDEDFAVEDDDGDNEDSGEDSEGDVDNTEDEEPDGIQGAEQDEGNLLDDVAEEQDPTESSSTGSAAEVDNEHSDDAAEDSPQVDWVPRKPRLNRIVSDDEEEADKDLPRSPELPIPAKTPLSLTRSTRKQIPGLQMSDDLPIGLTQAFDATMADSQSQDLPVTQEQDSLQMTADLPSPNLAMVPKLYRLDSIDVITDSQPASQTQPLNVNLSFSQSEMVPQSPAIQSGVTGMDMTPSQPQFEPTQDGGYVLSPFMGNRFAIETPQRAPPHSTVDTIVVPNDLQDSPIMQRKSRLKRGRAVFDDSDDEAPEAKDPSAFDVMQRAAAKQSREAFDKQKSRAREAVDDAAEESEDEYAGLGGASDDEINDEENEDDRRMIDEDTQVGVGDEVKLAKLFADRERQQDEAAVSKLLKDITTGALRRKRGNDDLDLSDEEDAVVRRREAKRREFAKMRRELLKDEAVGKIAEDKKKEAFLRSIEDRPNSDDDDDDFDRPETQPEEDSQTKDGQNTPLNQRGEGNTFEALRDTASQPPATAGASKLNQGVQIGRRSGMQINRKPGTLAEIRESVSFLIEEPDSQAGTIDLGLSDSDDDAEAYVDLDRHFQAAEADENAEEANDLGDFIVDDDDGQPERETTFKKPALPTSESRAPFSERRTRERVNVVNRLSMLRQQSSSGTSNTTKMAFYTSTSSANSSFGKVPTLLRRATTNSSLGSMAGRDENVSATGVVTNKTERGKASDEKTFVRKGTGGRRNAVNYRPTVREEKMSQRAGVAKKAAAKAKKGGFLGGLLNGGSWN
jgi:mediator of replication checkpoint protein 1